MTYLILGLFNDTFSTAQGTWCQQDNYEWRIGNVVEGSGHAIFKTITHCLPGEPKENHKMTLRIVGLWA